MTPTEREAHRKLQDEIKRRKSLGESNYLILHNGKIIQYVPKFQTRVLVNNTSAAVKLHLLPL